MSYTVNYSQLSLAEKYERTLRDAVDWLGEKEAFVRGVLLAECQTLRSARFALAFVGLQGLPARRYWLYINQL